MDKRGQFTFYASVFEAARRIRNKAARADFYDAICDYGLNGVEPDLDKLSDAAAIGFISARPNLDASRKKAASGKTGGSVKQKGSKKEAKRKQSGSEKENEREKENENEIENECYARAEGFASFWNAFPNAVLEDEARNAWAAIPLEEYPAVMEGLGRWKRSVEWAKKDGEYIPRPARWLFERRWRDHPLELTPRGATGDLGQAEIEAIGRMMGWDEEGHDDS